MRGEFHSGWRFDDADAHELLELCRRQIGPDRVQVKIIRTGKAGGNGARPLEKANLLEGGRPA
jgi:hypothetical protein